MRRSLTTLLGSLSLLSASLSFAAVDVNTASVTELRGVKSIGSSTAQRIVKERQKGEFKDWQDLIHRVSGIGERNALKASNGGLLVHGSTYTGSPSGGKTPVVNATNQAAAKDPKDAAGQQNAAPAIGAQAPAVGKDRPTPATRSPDDRPAPANTSPATGQVQAPKQ